MILVVALVPYGPLLAVISLMAAAAWTGRERTPPPPTGPDEAQTGRLQSLYEALVPYFSAAEDPAPLYAHGGDWEKAFASYDFDDDSRVSRLLVRYPAYFTDGEPDARARIEQLLHAKSGRGREYHFEWDEEGNELTVTVLPPLPTDITAQRFVTAPAETVLGFTDPTDVQRTLPSATARSSGTSRRSSGAPASARRNPTCSSRANRAPARPRFCVPSLSRPFSTAMSSSSTAEAPASTRA